MGWSTGTELREIENQHRRRRQKLSPLKIIVNNKSLVAPDRRDAYVRIVQGHNENVQGTEPPIPDENRGPVKVSIASIGPGGSGFLQHGQSGRIWVSCNGYCLVIRSYRC